jgi:zinc transport system ATP-binding protein
MSEQANILEVSNLKVVLGQNTVLEDINFKLPKGAYLAIVGPNGSGKTTLMKTLIGLVKPNTGNVKMFGADVDDLPPGTISYVPQIKTMDKSFPARAIDLVMSGIKRRWSFKIKSHDSDRVAAIMHEVGAGDFIYRPLAALSGGELQRVFLARSLIRNPKILLLDEPATGIDLVCELSINKLITEYNQKFGTTVIMITHDWSAAYHHTNYVLLLNRRQVYYGESKTAFTDENLQLTFSHLGHGHGIKFGLKI